MSRIERFRAWWAHAFAVDGDEAFDGRDRALIDRLAAFVVRRRMTSPALMLLESGRPLNFVGSQLLTFLAPFVTMVFSKQEYNRFTGILERRGSIDLIIERIEEAESRIQNPESRMEK
ncbi:MAG: hypothetical protein A3F84_07355 [Candidatus Handelsmanbacteria bacterium RIFCSPLOWO2_12_FULL_64_10]|uniref:Uncharacterized protein n=1 Tax=Handelsmanbacteria sp. (strain RIFCSPLOWO2_12_FULL_64_10) TaxID=1817868 RepID=A0A1F6CKT9_HANXR|nr:MAG: hypothetical protein A3F84_07355 [Candidatus Handelsmanbacteria bacterium RIFCSPLOWO2_12_FULL_64_10]